MLPEGEEDNEEEVKIDENSLLEFTQTMIVREQVLEDLEANFIVGNTVRKVMVVKELVENPTPETLSKATMKLLNKLIFDSIQEV